MCATVVAAGYMFCPYTTLIFPCATIVLSPLEARKDPIICSDARPFSVTTSGSQACRIYGTWNIAPVIWTSVLSDLSASVVDENILVIYPFCSSEGKDVVTQNSMFYNLPNLMPSLLGCIVLMK
jgi:hypothetical protein